MADVPSSFHCTLMFGHTHTPVCVLVNCKIDIGLLMIFFRFFMTSGEILPSKTLRTAGRQKTKISKAEMT